MLMTPMRYYILIMCMLVAVVAPAQVINSIGNEAMKIPRGERPEPRVQPRLDDVVVDTDTPYFHQLDSAQACINAGQWSQAERYLKMALRLEPSNPNNPLVLSNIATLQRRDGRLDEALKNYNLAIDLAPNAVTLLLNRAALQVSLDSLTRATADYQRVLDLEPSNTEALYSLGMLALSSGDAKRAEDLFNTIKRVNPNSGLALEGMAALNKSQGNYVKAASQLSELIKVKPSARLLGMRADCYLMSRRLPDASTDIQNALQLDPEDGYLYLLRAKLNKMRYNYEDMERDSKLAVSHGVDPEEVNNALK